MTYQQDPTNPWIVLFWKAVGLLILIGSTVYALPRALKRTWRFMVTCAELVRAINRAAPILINVGALKKEVDELKTTASGAMTLATEGLAMAREHGRVLTDQNSVLASQSALMAKHTQMFEKVSANIEEARRSLVSDIRVMLDERDGKKP